MPEADAGQGAGLPVGEYLKSVRESRGIGLDQASRVTKIGKNYLVAMEQGQFDKLPNQAYIKGFLRLYAGFLSLSGDEIVRRYEQGLPSAARPQAEPKAEGNAEVYRSSRLDLTERVRLGGRGRWLVPLVLLCLVILAALFLSEGDEKRNHPVAKPAETPAAPPAKVAVQPQRSSALPAAPASSALHAPAQAPTAAVPGAPPVTSPGTPTPQAPQTADRRSGAVLKLRFVKDSWLSITIDDSISQRYDLKAGDIIEWKGSRSFVVDLGDGAAAEAEFDGKPLKALGEAGKPAHAELKAQAPVDPDSKGR